MKFENILTVLLLGLILSLAGCKKETPETLIVNKWKLNDWILVPGMMVTDSVKAEMLKSASMEFKADKTYLFYGMNDMYSTGSYSLSEDGKTLTLIPTESTIPYDSPIVELSKTKLVMIDPMGNKLICIP